jgi:hypothetical protein
MENNVTTIDVMPEPSRAEEPGSNHLLAPDFCTQLRSRWESVQAGFVDEPREAVKQADGLVSETIAKLSETFAREREQLERQWSQGGEASTEDLRQALRRYRAFFQRLLAV